MKKLRKRALIYPIVMTVLTYLPILVVAVYSFNESKLSSKWDGFSLKWYAELFRDDSILEALGNSVFLGVTSSVLAAVIATSAALGMAKSKLPLKRWVEKLALLPLIIPEIVLGMIFLAFFSLLGLPFGMLTLIIAHTAFCIPYIYTEVAAALENLDLSAVEAARDLGAGRLTAFFTVTLPMLSPAVISGMFLSFAMSFDDVIISIFVTGVSVNTLPIKVYTQIKTGLSPKINALCTIMLAVSVLCLAIAGILKKIHRKYS
jgi:spermidine/putrescine transport system permease protein